MTIQKFIGQHLRKRLEEGDCLIVFDPDRRYEKIVEGLQDKECTVIDVSQSTIVGREQAVDAWLRVCERPVGQERLVLYLPKRRPQREHEKQQNPYQFFALAGAEFPRDDGDEYQSLCRRYCPQAQLEVDEAFKEGPPSFDVINKLAQESSSWPHLETLLKVSSPAEILLAVLAPSQAQEDALQDDEAWIRELRELLKTSLGLQLKTESKKREKVALEVWRFMLFSEFVLDLEEDLPSELESVPHAEASSAGLIESVCEQLRNSDRHREGYMEAAEKVERNLQLATYFEEGQALGSRDTFAFEDRAFLQACSEAAVGGDLKRAEEMVASRRSSLWVQYGDRQLWWEVVGRALRLLRQCDEITPELKGQHQDLKSLLDFYRSEFHNLDTSHRNLEQAICDTYGDLGPTAGVVEQARQRYLRCLESLQKAYVELVTDEGWPASGYDRATDVFDRFVAPWLESKKKVAYVMADALRYELGLELYNQLSQENTSEFHACCAQLPTITPVGMAALLPATAGTLALSRIEDKLVAHIGERRVDIPERRFEYIRSLYGDRCQMVELGEVLKMKTGRKRPPTPPDLLIVRSSEIDEAGENTPGEAWRTLPHFAKKIVAATHKLKKAGFDRVVIATDHGFLLFSEYQPGDALSKPPGEWALVKDRCLLGKGTSDQATVLFPKEQVSIRGDFEHYVVPRTLATFRKGSVYFHEGLSIQECLIPVISIDLAESRPTSESTVEIRLSYKGGKAEKITTRRPVIEVSMVGLLPVTVKFQLVANARGNKVVGEVAASEHVDPATNLISMMPGQAIKVVLRMEEDFTGSFEVRASDPALETTYDRLKLRTDYVA